MSLAFIDQLRPIASSISIFTISSLESDMILILFVTPLTPVRLFTDLFTASFWKFHGNSPSKVTHPPSTFTFTLFSGIFQCQSKTFKTSLAISLSLLVEPLPSITSIFSTTALTPAIFFAASSASNFFE